jgi:hypothetical protein
MRQSPYLALVVGLVLAGCGQKGASPTKVNADSENIEAGASSAFDTLSKELQKHVVAGDAGAIETYWLTPDELAGCNLQGEEESSEKIEKFLSKHLDGFRKAAEKNLSEAAVGEMLHVNEWTQPQPELMNKDLEGENCKAQEFGRVNVIIKPTSGKPKVIEHRFNTLYVNGNWKLFRYLPGTPTCDGPGKDKWIGCQKLAEQGG